jgi:hypothetical protein
MGLRNGDKARHHRIRKQKLARRVRMRELQKLIIVPVAAPAAAPAA